MKDMKVFCYPIENEPAYPDDFMSGWYSHDKDMDENLDRDEWAQAVNPQSLMVTSEQSFAMFDEADVNQDQKVSMSEGYNWYVELGQEDARKQGLYRELWEIVANGDADDTADKRTFRSKESELRDLGLVTRSKDASQLFEELDMNDNGHLESTEACIGVTGQHRGCVSIE